MDKNTIIFLVIILITFIFWIILKISRVKLYTYKKKNYPKEYKKDGYQTMSVSYIYDIFKNSYKKDMKYTKILIFNRQLFLITLLMIIITIYAAFKII